MGLNVNGKYHSYASIEASYISGSLPREIVRAVSSISYGQTLERERVWGTGQHDLGSTDPRVVPDAASLTLRKPAFYALIAKLGSGYGDISISWVFKYRNGIDPVIVDQLQCMIDGDQSAHTVGPAPLDIVVPIYVESLVRNGVTILKANPNEE